MRVINTLIPREDRAEVQTALDVKLGELVSHQLPSPTSPSLPSVAPSVKAACEFFGVTMPAAPTGSLDVDDAGISRP